MAGLVKGGSSCSSLQVAQAGLGSPSSFCNVTLLSLLVVLEFLLILPGLMRNSQKAWLPYFCRSGQRETGLDEFNFEVEGWLPFLRRLLCRGLLGRCLLRLYGVRVPLLVAWMAGVGGSLRLCLFPGLMVLLESYLRLRAGGSA